MEIPYDQIVIGAGINGSWTAYHLAKNGQRVLLLDQFPLPHSRGSSHGQSRCIRTTYAEDYIMAMMKDAFKQWRDLEQDSGIKLYTETGCLSMGHCQDDHIKEIIDSFETNGSPYEKWSWDVLKAKYPCVKADPGYVGIYDQNAGILFSDKALKAIWDACTKVGVKIMDNCPVTSLVAESSNPVKVVTEKRGVFSAKSLVLCAGPWTNKLLSSLGWRLPLTPVKIPVYYYRFRDFIPHCFIYRKGDHHVWGLPSIEYPNMAKICLHDGPEVDPDLRDHVSTEDLKTTLTKLIQIHFPEVDPKPAIEESCIYTMSPDGVHILDQHPRHSNIIVGCGFSGTGFKLAPITGEMLANLALNKRQKHPIHHFSAKRFSSKL